MNFSVISEDDVRAKFRKAENKIAMIHVLSGLTASRKEEVAEFLGVTLTDKYPWVLEEKSCL